jgi:DNA-binding transcriptional LysR family regulator
MNFNSAFYFFEVVKTGSFVKAASKIGIPKSTLSDKISELEHDLGVTLLVRTTRKLSLTEAGKQYFERCAHALSELQSAKEEIAQTQSSPQGLIRISTLPSFADDALATAVAEFRALYPQVSFEIDSSERQVDLIGEGFDIAVRGGHLSDSSLIARKIGKGSFILLASPKYLKKRGTPKHPKDLASHDCLMLQLGDETYNWVLKGPQGKTVRIKVVGPVIANSAMTIKALLLKGQGIALFPSLPNAKEVLRGELVHVLPEWLSPEEPVHIVYPAQRFFSPKLKAFIPLLEKHLKIAIQDL